MSVVQYLRTTEWKATKFRNLRTSYVNIALGADGDDIGHEEQNEDNEGRGDSGGNDKNDALQEHMRQVSRSTYVLTVRV